MNQLRETCHCGHDKATHYLDNIAQPPERVSCLASACECRRYVNEHDPKPKAAPELPTDPPPFSDSGWFT